MRMWVTCADQVRGEVDEPDRFQSLAELFFAFVDKAFSERDAEDTVGDELLEACPLHLQAVVGVHVLEDEQASWREPRVDTTVHLVADRKWDAIGRVDDRDRLERSPDRVIEGGD